MDPAGVRGRDLVVLYLSMAVTRIGFGVIIIIFPSYIVGAADITAAIALALYPVFEAFSAIPIGRLCDTRGRKTVFVAALGYVALLTAMIGLTRNIYLVALIHAFMGIGAAGITVASLTMITDLTHLKNRGTGMGLFDFGNVGGYGAGILLGGALHAYFGANLGDSFFVTATAIAVALGLSVTLLKEPSHPRTGGSLEFNPIKALDPRTKALLPVWLSLTSLIGIVFFLPRALARIGVGATATSVVLFLGIITLGVGSIGFGALSDRVGRDKVMVIGIVGLLGLLVSLSGVVGGTSTITSLVRNVYLIGPFAFATSALVPTILATVGDRAREETRGSAMGLYSVMLSGGIAVGTLIAGVAHLVGGLPAILDAGAVIFLAAALSSFVLLRRLKNRP